MNASSAGKPSRLPQWLVHHQVVIMLATALVLVATNFVGRAAGNFLAIGSITCIVGVAFAGGRHGAVLCERCAAGMPMNGAEVAAKRRRFLWWHHASGWRFLLFLVTAVVPVHNLARSVTLAVLLVGMAVADSAHLLVSLWCPWCSDGDGGDDGDTETAPCPPPTGAMQLSQ